MKKRLFANLEWTEEMQIKFEELVKFRNCDLTDFCQIDKVFKEFKVAAVMHFAAFSLVGESVKDPLKYFENNVQGAI